MVRPSTNHAGVLLDEARRFQRGRIYGNYVARQDGEMVERLTRLATLGRGRQVEILETIVRGPSGVASVDGGVSHRFRRVLPNRNRAWSRE